MSRIVGVAPGAGWYVRYPEDRVNYDASDDRVICFVVNEDGEAFPVIAGQSGEPMGLADWGNCNDNRRLIHETER